MRHTWGLNTWWYIPLPLSSLSLTLYLFIYRFKPTSSINPNPTYLLQMNDPRTYNMRDIKKRSEGCEARKREISESYNSMNFSKGKKRGVGEGGREREEIYFNISNRYSHHERSQYHDTSTFWGRRLLQRHLLVLSGCSWYISHSLLSFLYSLLHPHPSISVSSLLHLLPLCSSSSLDVLLWAPDIDQHLIISLSGTGATFYSAVPISACDVPGYTCSTSSSSDFNEYIFRSWT